MVLNQIKNKVIVSCQALESEPLHSSFIMGRMALAAMQGGASGIRANGCADINEIKKTVELPVIGIVKRDYEDSDVYITATVKEVNELLTTSAEIIALDATRQKRPKGESVKHLVDVIHENNRYAMADISTLEEAVEAEKIGFDMVSTTLAGYTPYSKKTSTPDFTLLKSIVEQVNIPVILEGHVDDPKQVRKAFEMGVHSVVVGSIITRPQLITKRYTEAANQTFK